MGLCRVVSSLDANNYVVLRGGVGGGEAVLSSGIRVRHLSVSLPISVNNLQQQGTRDNMNK